MRWVCLILAAFIVSFGYSEVWKRDRAMSPRAVEGQLREARGQMNAIADYTRAYARAAGRYPTNDEGLRAVKPLMRTFHGRDSSDRRLEWCSAGFSGILTSWGEPFIYENRRGLAQSAFAESGATLDTGHRYSVQVDKGIWIWSVGARRVYEAQRRWSLQRTVIRLLIILLGAALLAVYIIASRRTALGKPNATGRVLSGAFSGIAALLSFAVASVLASALALSTVYSCYLTLNGSPPDRGPVQDYLKTIAAYRDRGVISDTAYRKLVDAIERDEACP